MNLAKKFLIFVFLMIISLSCQAQYKATQEGAGESEFFSYKRFLNSANLIGKIVEDKGAQKGLRDFAAGFTAGLSALEAGDTNTAKGEFFKASDAWPEYFGADFLLALSFEKNGDIDTAARFYKSYLLKLKDFHEGRYKISDSLIRILGEGKIEGYKEAYDLIEARLAVYGIDLDKVRPVAVFPAFLLYIILLALFAVLYLALAQWVFPYIRKMKKMRHPPEGFWVCRYCGAASPDLSNVCNDCRRPRPV